MSFTPFHITMIDDDVNFLNVLSMSLEEIFRFKTFQRPEEALRFIKETSTDGVFLDLHLEDTDGFSVCKAIKSLKNDLPVFFLTSDCEIKSIEAGFETGGIDYFSKSIALPELRARVSKRMERVKNQMLEHGDLSMDIRAHRVFVNKEEVTFTPKEYEILKVFMERPNQLLTKADLLGLLWKDVFVDANNIDTHMFHMRKKLKDALGQIQTRKGLGYILVNTSHNVSKR